ncbi:MAG: PAS domain-containing protein, partial [Desulfocapsa sp.]|nr:PAS domain-containing protein [Desulfocapsa sp.]
QQHALDKLINTKVNFANLLAKNVLQQTTDRYQKRIKGFINYKSVKTKELFINALVRQDKASLLHLTQPFLEIFQKENPYFNSLSWILPDNTIILRVQKPELSRDNISTFLPDVVEANLTKTEFHGFGVARSGMQYRIVEPVVYNGQHVGVVLFGLKASFISDMLEEQLDVPSGLAILNEECDFVEHTEKAGLRGNTHTVRVSDKKIFDILPKNIDWSQQRRDFHVNDRNYILLNLFPLKNYIGKQLGRYFIILDVTEEREAASRIFYRALVACCLLLVLSFVVIYVGYNALVQKIVNLNQTLQNNNLELEDRVNERTIDLQESESQLRQIIDLVPHFIFVKDETGKFEIVNKATAEVFGTTVEDLTGRKDVEFVKTDEELENFRSDDFEVIKSGKIKFIPEEKITDSENKTRYLQTTKVPFKISGTEISALLGIAVDITDRKHTEQQIIRLNHLREELLGLTNFNEKLIHITDAVVDIFDADFCRVWIIKSADRCNDSCPHAEATEGPHVCLHRERCLHLAASSGRYSGLDSAMHGRVPFGCYKIGMIASGAIESFNTNDVTHDSQVHDHDWAKKLGLVSFAGYCL